MLSFTVRSKNFVIAFFLLVISSFSYCQDATLDETLSWIKGKIESQPPRWLNEGKSSVIRDWTFNYDNCVIEYSFKVYAFVTDKASMRSDRFDQETQKVDLTQVAVAALYDSPKEESSNNEPTSQIFLEALWGQKVVKKWYPNEVFASSSHTTERTAQQRDVLIIWHHEANRLQKAFHHAIKLCGGGLKEEKF